MAITLLWKGFLGRSGSVFRPETASGEPYDDLYTHEQHEDIAYFKDYYYGGRVLLGYANSNDNLVAWHAGLLQSDWSVSTRYGVNKVPSYRDRTGKFFFDNSDELKGTGYLQTHGVQVGLAHEIPLTGKLFLRMEYDYTNFSERTEKSTLSTTGSLGESFTYKPKSDQFQIGMKYRLARAQPKADGRQMSRYPTGWYLGLDLHDDFNKITKKIWTLRAPCASLE